MEVKSGVITAFNKQEMESSGTDREVLGFVREDCGGGAVVIRTEGQLLVDSTVGGVDHAVGFVHGEGGIDQKVE